jgi:hypothetical protein
VLLSYRRQVGGETRHWWREGREGLVFLKGEAGALTRVGVASEHGLVTMGDGAGEVERRRDDLVHALVDLCVRQQAGLRSRITMMRRPR